MDRPSCRGLGALATTGPCDRRLEPIAGSWLTVAGNRIPLLKYAGCHVRGRGAVLLTHFATSTGVGGGNDLMMISKYVTADIRYAVSAVDKTSGWSWRRSCLPAVENKARLQLDAHRQRSAGSAEAEER